MYTLKIKWMRYEDGEQVDESTLFIPADQVSVHGDVKTKKEMSAWAEGTYFDYHIDASETAEWGARLIQVDKDGKSTWYLASLAWLMGPTGQTIEKLHG